MPNASISIDGTEVISKTDGVISLPVNRNLIINGDFRVNQREAASRTETTSEYNYDRWYYDGTYLYQGIEDLNVFNDTYTISWTDAGSDITAAYKLSTDSVSGDGPDATTGFTSVSNKGNIVVNEATEFSKHLWIRFGGTLANLSRVQVEVGNVATPFEKRHYGTELALCQRYYYKCIHNEGRYSYASTNFHYWFPVIMRVAPAIAGNNILVNRIFLDGITFNPYTGNIGFITADAEL